MTRRIVIVLALCGLTLLSPTVVMAQDTPLSQLLVNLIQTDIRLAPPQPPFQSHEAHFIPGADQKIAPYFFNQQLITQLATVPIGSPAGGFAFTFDAAGGTFQRATESFGPAFADRALTNGRGKVTVGANFQYSKYTSFEGTDLNDGALKFYLRHQDIPGSNFFEGDLVETAVNLDLSSSTTTLFGNVGVTDRWDVAVAIPIEHVSMNATVNATIQRLATGATGPTSGIHQFVGGGTTATYANSGSASGIGDVVFRTKYRFATLTGGGLAANFDLRLPSGDVDNLLGTGATQATITLIGSAMRGRFGPHFNIGYTGSNSGDVVDIPNEFGYRFGTEFMANPRTTLSVDLVGRTLRNVGKLEYQDTVWPYMTAAGAQQSTTLHELVSGTGSLNLASLAFGGKVNVTGNLLINANVLVGLTSNGLTARFTPVIGFDYSF